MADDATQIEGAIAEAPQWRRWLACLVLGSAGGAAVLFAFIVLIDPYSTGRLALMQRLDRVPVDAWLAKAGVIRDPQFDAAIIGASTADALDPASIGAASGLNVVQLAFPGTAPRTTRLMSQLFASHHRGKSTLQILIIIGEHWCAPNPITAEFFPYRWIYQSTNWEYLSEIFNTQALRLALRRVGIWLGVAGQSIPENGFGFRLPNNFDPQATARKLLEMKPAPDAPAGPFPELDALSLHLGALDRGTAVLLTVLPKFVNALPPAGSAAEARDTACRDTVRQIAAQRPNTGFLDLQGDNEMARHLPSYIDGIHFHDAVARMVEREIAKAILALQSHSR